MYLFHICTMISEICIIIISIFFVVKILEEITDPEKNVGLLCHKSYNENYLGNKWFYVFIFFNLICFLFYKRIKKLRRIDYYKYKIKFYQDLLDDIDVLDKYDEKYFKSSFNKYSRLLKL